MAALISIWDWRRGELLRTMHTDFAVGLTFDPSGERILTMFGPPVIWDVETGARIGTLDEYPNGVGTVAFSHDGSRLAATASGNVVLFDPETGTKQFVLRTPDLLQPLRLAFNEDGSMLATQAPNPLGDEPGIVRVWALDIDDALDLARREVTIALSDQRMPAVLVRRRLFDVTLDVLLCGPGVEQRVRFGLVDGAALESKFHQVLQRLADDAPGFDTQVLHHLSTVQRRAHGLQILLLGESARCALPTRPAAVRTAPPSARCAWCSRRG